MADRIVVDLFVHDRPPWRLNPNMVICLCTHDYWPRKRGGIARVYHDMAHAFTARGHQVHVLTRGYDRPNVQCVNGIWLHYIVPDSRSVPKCPFPDLPEHIWNYSWAVYLELSEMCRSLDIDIVQSPIWLLEGVAFLADNRWRNVVSLHTTLADNIECGNIRMAGGPDNLAMAEGWIKMEGRHMEQAPYLMANSKAILHTVGRLHGVEIPDHKVIVIPHGIEDRSAAYARRRNDHVVEILFVGRLDKRKGADVLLQCIPELCKKFGNIRFIVLGDDTIVDEQGNVLRDKFMERHRGAEFLEKVHFTGVVSDKELFQHYADCDMFVAPSRYESFGLVFLEAMMFGKPVIGCRAGGMPEIIRDEVNGLLAAPGDADSLKAAITKLIQDSEKREAFGRQSRMLFEANFTLAEMVEKTLGFYSNCLKK